MGLDLRGLRLAPIPPQPICEPLGHDAHAGGLFDELVEVWPTQCIPPVRRRQELLEVEPAAPVARVDGVVEVRLDVPVLVGCKAERNCDAQSQSGLRITHKVVSEL